MNVIWDSHFQTTKNNKFGEDIPEKDEVQEADEDMVS